MNFYTITNYIKIYLLNMGSVFPFASFRSRKYFIRILVLGGCLFLTYQFLGVIQLTKLLTDRATGQVSGYEDGKFKSSKSIPTIIGVLPQHIKFYKPTSEGMFKCVKSDQEIAFIQVNDDYCDCKDFSDEPSTTACSGGRFFCTKQPEGSKVFSIVSSKVNDGICDCCDGSDEWANVLPPAHSQVPDALQKQFRIYQTPCKYNC